MKDELALLSRRAASMKLSTDAKADVAKSARQARHLQNLVMREVSTFTKPTYERGVDRENK